MCFTWCCFCWLKVSVFKVTKTDLWMLPFCVQQSVADASSTRLEVWQKYKTHHKLTPFLLLLLIGKSKPKRLHPEKLRPKAKKCFSINSERPTKWSMQLESFAHFLYVKANLLICFLSPLSSKCDELCKEIEYTGLLRGVSMVAVYKCGCVSMPRWS